MIKHPFNYTNTFFFHRQLYTVPHKLPTIRLTGIQVIPAQTQGASYDILYLVIMPKEYKTICKVEIKIGKSQAALLIFMME